MKKVLVYALILSTLLVSGCIQADFEGAKSVLGMSSPQYTATERLSVSASSVLDEVESGMNTTLIFDLVNEGNTTVRNVSIDITDFCVFEGPTSTEIPEMEPREKREWEVPARAGPVNMNRNCKIRSSIAYKSNATALYDISAISESERLRLKKQGKLKNKTNLNYYKTNTPIDIRISTSESQPIVAGDTFLLDLKLVNQGIGTVEDQKLSEGDVTIKYPKFLSCMGCQGVMKDVKGKKVLKLDKERTFLNGKAASITCRFKVKENEVDLMKDDRFEVGVRYKYVVDKELPVRVVPE